MVSDLASLSVAVDVQHLYRTDHPRDRGTIFTLPDGTHVAEGDAATLYAAALTRRLRDRGARVLENDPPRGILCGTYGERNRAAAAWGAHVYLACHVNAGRGSYAEAEAMRGTEGERLAPRVMTLVALRVPAVLSFTYRLLEARVGRTPPSRGAVCVEAFPPGLAAVILEPFFGDNPHQAGLFLAPALAQIGEAIADGVGAWWLGRMVATTPPIA
jgi:N-acetylmuramoyl-L-alanine amidase